MLAWVMMTRTTDWSSPTAGRSYNSYVEDKMEQNQAHEALGGQGLKVVIRDPRDVLIIDGDQPLSSITRFRFEAAVDQIPPVLEVEVPDPTIPGMADDIKESIATTIEAIQRYGGRVVFRADESFKLDTNEQEQFEAEETVEALARGQ